MSCLPCLASPTQDGIIQMILFFPKKIIHRQKMYPLTHSQENYETQVYFPLHINFISQPQFVYCFFLDMSYFVHGRPLISTHGKPVFWKSSLWDIYNLEYVKASSIFHSIKFKNMKCNIYGSGKLMVYHK